MKKVLERELATLKKEHKRLEREHMGKFVLIHGDEVVNVFDYFETAANEGLRQFGRKPFLIRRVGENTVELPVAVVYGLTDAHPANPD